MNLGFIPCVLIDSTVLRSSLYDSQATWEKTTRYGWYTGYKVHVCSTPEGVVLSHFVQTILGKQLMEERRKIEQQFSHLKDKGLEQPRWYGQNGYLLHVHLVFLIHNIAYLF